LALPFGGGQVSGERLATGARGAFSHRPRAATPRGRGGEECAPRGRQTLLGLSWDVSGFHAGLRL